jgi:hypothetical protein
MSYLDLPRIQFGGLFFTNPDTINNIITNYNPDVPLENAQGQYLPNAGWYALGVAQLWLEECTVLSALGQGGAVDSGDPILGATVQTPSPKTPLKTADGKGFYDIAKMVDLDPQQQIRSAVYGLRYCVKTADGAGFSGLMTVPELQYISGRSLAQTGSWAAVGTWMGQIEAVDWFGDLDASPFLKEFQAACAQGVAVKLNMDLHQNNPSTQFTSGNQFFYGRILGTLGPVEPHDQPQLWPGRILLPVPSGSSSGTSAALAVEGGVAEALAASETGMTLDDLVRGMTGAMHTRMRASLTAETAEAPPLPWNAAPAQTQEVNGETMLHVDLGGSILVPFQEQNGIFSSDGTFVVSDGITVGVVANGSFQPLTHGALSFTDQYQPLNSISKTVNLIKNSGLFTVPLSAAEATLVASNPLAIQVDGTGVVQEAASGLLLNLSQHSQRLDQAGTTTVTLMARQFGQPVVGQKPVTWTVQPLRGGGEASDITVEWLSATDANGLAQLQITATDRALTLSDLRKPLDSLVYNLTFTGPDGPIGDQPQEGSNTTVLLFNRFVAPANPTWQDDVGPILQAYARLYPGMTDRLDIGDEATVQGFALAMHDRMARPFADPGYMPVTRDLTSTKVAMILEWLQPYLPKEAQS